MQETWVVVVGVTAGVLTLIYRIVRMVL